MHNGVPEPRPFATYPAGSPGLLEVAPPRAGMRTDAFLAHELPALSRTLIRQKVQTGEVLINGHRCSTATRVRAGDWLRISWRGAPVSGPLPEMPVLFEDEWLLAVDKPAGVASHPVGRRQHGTVVQWARARYAGLIRADLERGGREFYPTLVNRLDVFTSGIILLAKTRTAHAALQDIVTRRLVSKEYIALVEGVIAEDQGRMDSPIGLDPDSAVRVKRALRPDGLPSVTTYTVLRRLPGRTLISAFPITGRQHQIRVHCSGMGHPVCGDLLYRDERLFLLYLRGGGAPDGSLPARQLLHAARVSFTHPLTGARVVIESPLPEDFLAVVKDLEKGAPGRG
jgi:23S rRNA pseudouridine1911/1915/1917 synthase